MQQEPTNGAAVPDVVGLCCDLVRIPSVTGDDAEVETARYLSRLFESWPSLECREYSGRPGRPNVVCVLRSSREGPTLLLNGHLDVQPANPDEWTYPPFSGEIVDGQLWGRGASDMKGGVAALATAMLEVAARGGPSAGNLVFTATADEEGEGYWGLPWLLNEGIVDVDAAIIGEAAGIDRDFEHVYVASRGYATLRVTIDGSTGHSSLHRRGDDHAISVACRLQREIELEFLAAPRHHWAFEDGTTLIVGETFHADAPASHLPSHVSFSIKGFVIPDTQRDDLLVTLRAFIEARVPPRFSVSVSYEDGIAPWAPGGELDATHPLARLALDALHEEGYPDATFGGCPFFTEGAFLAERGKPCLPSLGPGRIIYAHRPDERVAVSVLRDAVRIYLRLIDELLVPDSPLSAERQKLTIPEEVSARTQGG